MFGLFDLHRMREMIALVWLLVGPPPPPGLYSHQFPWTVRRQLKLDLSELADRYY